METLTGNQLRDQKKTDNAAVPQDTADSAARDVGVTTVNAGIAEVLSMRVGCWRAPVHLTTEPSAA